MAMANMNSKSIKLDANNPLDGVVLPMGKGEANGMAQAEKSGGRAEVVVSNEGPMDTGAAPEAIARFKAESLPFLQTLLGLSRAEANQTPMVFQVYGGGRPWTLSGSFKALAKILERHNVAGSNIAVTINALRGDHRHKEDVTGIRALWLDYDAKLTETPLGLEQILERLPLPPTMVTKTGSPGSYHVYWCTDTVVDLPVDPVERQAMTLQVEGAIRTISGLVPGGDPAVATLERILRVPGFLNVKPEANGARCVIVDLGGPRYPLGQLLEVFPPTAAPVSTSSTSKAIINTKDLVYTNDPQVIEMVTEFLTDDAEPAIQGENGSATCFGVVMVAGPGHALAPEVCLELLAEHYNPRCDPEWSDAELVHKVSDAYAKAERWAWKLPEALDPAMVKAVDAWGLDEDDVLDAPAEAEVPADLPGRRKKKPNAGAGNSPRRKQVLEGEVLEGAVTPEKGQLKTLVKDGARSQASHGIDSLDDEPEDPTRPELTIDGVMYDWAEVGNSLGRRPGLQATVQVGYGDKPNYKTAWLAQPFWIEALVMDGKDDSYATRVSWLSDEGIRHEKSVPRSSLIGDSCGVFRAMAEEGFCLATRPDVRQLLADYLHNVKVSARGRLSATTGWCDSAYVFPDETLGTTTSGRRVYLSGKGNENLTTKGTLSEWQTEIGVHAVGNSRLSLGIALAFVGPILDLVGADSFGVHMASRSTRGKSTIGEIAGSVWGGPRFTSTWKGTANGVEAALAGHNHSMLVLDEILQADPKQVAEIVYLIAGNTGKSRMTKVIEARESLTWRVAVLSNGEVTPADQIKKAGLRVTAGGDVRMMTVQMLEAGFEQIGTFETTEAFTNHLLDAKARFFGTPIRAFINYIVGLDSEDRIALVERLKATSREWAAEAVPATADPQVRRGARQFGLIYAAGALAQEAGVLPWPDENIGWAVRVCLDAWIEARGGLNSQEQQTGIQNVLAFIEAHGTSRFISDCDGFTDDRPVHHVAGYKKCYNSPSKGLTRVDWLLTSEGFQEACGGENARDTAKSLRDAGILDAGAGRGQKKFRIPGTKDTTYVYWLKGPAISAYREKTSGDVEEDEPVDEPTISMEEVDDPPAPRAVAVSAMGTTAAKPGQDKMVLPAPLWHILRNLNAVLVGVHTEDGIARQEAEMAADLEAYYKAKDQFPEDGPPDSIEIEGRTWLHAYKTGAHLPAWGQGNGHVHAPRGN